MEQVVESVLSLDGDALSGLVKGTIEQDQDLIVFLNRSVTAGLRKLGQGFHRGGVLMPGLMMGAQSVQASLQESESLLAIDNLPIALYEEVT